VHTVENVVNDAAFWAALVIAAAGVALVVVRARHRHHEPGVAIVVVLACLVGLRVEHRLPAPLVVGLALLLLGDWLTRDESGWAPVVGSVPGALVIGAALPDGWPFWIRAVVVGSTIVGDGLVAHADQVAPRLVPALFAIGAVGVYLCVPDTEAPKALMGALLAGALVGLEPRIQATLGTTALTGLFVWTAGYGGLGRPGSVVGGVACLGVLLLVPLVRWRAVSRAAVVVLVVVQCALVAYVSRVAGFEDSAWTALALCIPAFAIASAVLAVASNCPGSSGV
jgi:hypothetical protein